MVTQEFLRLKWGAPSSFLWHSLVAPAPVAQAALLFEGSMQYDISE
ncbi:unnamed protein product [Ixodes pacificus]